MYSNASGIDTANYGNHYSSYFTNSCTTPTPTNDVGEAIGNITNDPMFVANGSGYGMNHVSVTTTLTHGKPADVRQEMDWLVEKGPEVGLMLGCSSSVAPGVPIENMKALADGFTYYRKEGWKSCRTVFSM